jgi:DUF1680 family protein
MQYTFQPFEPERVGLLPSMFQQRYALNRKYMMSLATDNLLQNFYMEAGLWSPPQKPVDCHWGWESPTSQVRGHFLGHWLSGAASIYAETGDMEIKAKADRIVAELARCQQENGGEWVGSIPEKYLEWAARGKQVWAPHYTLHKTLMGLYDMYALAKNEQALDVMIKWAAWFNRWTAQFSRQQMDDILDVETGGMLESWANLYGVTGKQEHLELLNRYNRPRLFERLLQGEDALTNMHANTTIPEVQGAARAWEVTGDARWREIVEAYWRFAVTERAPYCTGGQTCGEIWTPPGELAARLGDKNQEHCTVYNMMRLAQYLLSWTGDVTYADYWERNLYNGILAQQHPQTGMITYFLPMQAGAVKKWGTPTDDFWCCHGTLVQAQTIYSRGCYYQDAEGIVVAQYIPTQLQWATQDTQVTLTQKQDAQTSAVRRPNHMGFTLTVKSDKPVTFALKLRIPWWVKATPQIEVNGEPVQADCRPSSFVTIRRTWQNDTVHVTLPKGLWTDPLPDQPEMAAFMDGPVVLAGLVDEERQLKGDASIPEALLVPDNEREWTNWIPWYRTVGQARGFRFIPLYEVRDERYTVYFPITK